MLVEQLANGLVVGLIYGLLALGFSLAYATGRVMNFAHGELFALGAFLGLTLQRSLRFSALAAALLAMLLVFVVGAAFAHLVLARLRTGVRRTVATITLALGLRDGMLLIFGSDSESAPGTIGPATFNVFGLSLPRSTALVAVASTALLIGCALILTFTRWGVHTRATAQDEELAASSGIAIPTYRAAAFGASAALAAAAGLLVAPTWQVNFAVGGIIGLKAFTAAMIGGLGNLPGAVLGGLLLGVSETLLAGYVSSTWKDPAVFLTLLLVLTVAPRGLLGSKADRIG